MNALVAFNAFSFLILFLMTLSLAKASCKTCTNGPLPDKKTACSSSATFKR